MAGQIVVIVGPTAVGKSRLALEVAQRFGGEIVTADSRQVYRYMDIGTAKPGSAERAAVRHHMLDLVDPNHVYSAGQFREEGERVLTRLELQGRLAVVAGGTGFYIRALLDGISLPQVEPNAELRARLRQEAAKEGAAVLHARLRASDPVSAGRIHPHNLPRIIRALEVVDALGGPVPDAQRRARPALYIGLSMERERLRTIADERVLSQMEEGLVEETRLLLEMGYDPDSPALAGFAYSQMVSYLRGELTLDEAIRDYQAATHRYIRRQMTWFRPDRRIHWIDASQPEPAAAALVSRWLATAS